MKTIPLLTRLLSVAVAATLSLQSIAAQLPDLGDTASGILSPALEKKIGEEALASYRFEDPGYIDDPELEAYFDSLGSRLTATGATGDRNFTFFVLKDSTINAFAMPGGVIGVHSGLVVNSQNESELAAVISHEMAHIVQHHIGRGAAAQSNSTAWMLASLLIAILAARNSPTATEAALATGMAAGTQNQLNFSRDFEREADRIGFQILTAAGFDPQGMPSFFTRMQQVSGAEDSAYAFLRTHPLTADRISDMQGRVRNQPYRQVPDSIEYALTRAKLAVIQETPTATFQRLRHSEGGRPQDKAARWYSLTLANLAQRNYAEAQRNFNQLAALKLKTPMIATLGAQIELEQGHGADAAKICHAARASYPGWRTLSYCEVQGLLTAGDGEGALALVTDLLNLTPGDFRLYTLEAKIYTALNKPALAHRAQSQVYLMHGLLQPAIEQMRLAQRSPGANAYEEAAIDAHLRELRIRLCEETDGKIRSDPRASEPSKDGSTSDKCSKLP